MQSLEPHTIAVEAGASIRNVRYVHSLLHRSLKDAANRRIVDHNAAHGARQPKADPKEIVILDEYQVVQFLIVVKGHRYEALFHLAVKTGMRQGKLFGLKWSDVEWQRGLVRVQRQVQRVKGRGKVFMLPKTKAGRRTIPLGTEMLQLLREHRAKQESLKVIAGQRWQENGVIFPSSVGTPISGSFLLKEYKLLLGKASLPRIRFHDLRHTAASIMLNRGVPPYVVSRILGHSKPSTTMDIYGHLIPVMHSEIENQIDEWLTPIQVQLGDQIEVLTDRD